MGLDATDIFCEQAEAMVHECAQKMDYPFDWRAAVGCGTNYNPAARQLIFVTHFTANETQATEPTLFSRNENFLGLKMFSYLICCC